MKHELISMGIKEDRISLIYNAIEDYWFENHKPEITENPQIVFIGRIGNDVFNLKLKGLDRIIHLYNRFKHVRKTTICMTTNKGVTSWLLNNIPNHSLFLNMKKDKIPEVIRWLRGSILFIPSRYEGFSLSLVEGMSQGLVPVAYPVGVATEIIRNGENGFIVTSQREAEEKIKLLLTNSVLRKKCALEAEITSKLFSSGEITIKLIKLYEDVVKGYKHKH
ncbi:MAG: hypothetical protein COV32_00845 [Candidatus Yonathbacteria bacterium CG10_big_fil_rev_8_21_14_0_10_43_136]|nr:MAG: hypothetical protein COV32_00845 [Candidatus Yonathbacteria bacterium CG10_big_fil_rev_8_21_14_0_10_43_136]